MTAYLVSWNSFSIGRDQIKALLLATLLVMATLTVHECDPNSNTYEDHASTADKAERTFEFSLD